MTYDALVTYDTTTAQIAEVAERYAGLEATTPDGYEEVRLAIGHLRSTRVAIEKRRVELKADALAFGRKCDAVAKDLTNRIEVIEAPLRAKKEAIDAEKERIRIEKARALVAEAEAKAKAEREAQEAIDKAARDAEEARIREERAKLEADKAALAEATRQAEEKAKAERNRIRAEQAALEFQRRALEEETAAKTRAAEQEAAVERGRLARLAMAPDVEKLAEFAARIRAVMSPPLLCSTQGAVTVIAVAVSELEEIAEHLEASARLMSP